MRSFLQVGGSVPSAGHSDVTCYVLVLPKFPGWTKTIAKRALTHVYMKAGNSLAIF